MAVLSTTIGVAVVCTVVLGVSVVCTVAVAVGDLEARGLAETRVIGEGVGVIGTAVGTVVGTAELTIVGSGSVC